jgi:sulfoxide reductase heme-binding subunit YedZ
MTTWILLRAAGIGAYVALFLSVAWGLLASAGLTPRRISRSAANLFHASVASTGLALLALHLALLLVDPVEPFAVAEVLVPLRSPYRPFAVTLGVVAMYAFVTIVVTSWLRRRVGTTWWRRIHLAAVPTFAVSLVHGLLAGTDSGQTWAVALYGTTAAVVLFLVVVRGLTARPRPERRTDARRTGPPRPDRSSVDDARTVREPASAA